jgi:hypothetical protein
MRSAITVQSEKLILCFRRSRLDVLFWGKPGSHRLLELAATTEALFGTKRFSSGCPEREAQAHPAIRVEARGLAQYNDSEL